MQGKSVDLASTAQMKQQCEGLRKNTDELFNSFSEFMRDPNANDMVLKNLDSFSSVCDNACVSIVSLDCLRF
jgi:hypothetical protein